MNTDEIKRKTARGIIALTIRTILLQTINLLAFFLLGIFLIPSSFGTFIVVSAVMRIFNTVTDVGLGAALIQSPEDPTPEELSTVFFFQILLVAGAVVLGLAATPIVVTYLKLDSNGRLLYFALLSSLFISSLKSVPSVLLERKLEFERQIIPQIIEALVFNIIVVYLSYRNYEVLAFVYGVFLSSLAGLPIYYLIQSWRPQLFFDKTKLRHYLHFGVLFQGKTALAVVKDDLLTFVVTGIVGTSGIGFWGWSQRWAYSPFRFIVDSVTKVTFPAYARMRQDVSELGRVIEKTLFAVTAVLFPILAGIATMVPVLIHLVPKYLQWQPAVPSLVILCFQAGLSAMSGILVNILDSHGKVGVTLKLMIFWIALTWIFTIVFTKALGFTGISLAALLVSGTLPLTLWLVKKEVSFNFVASIRGPIIATLGLVSTNLLINHFTNPSWATAIATSAIGVIIYLLIILVVEKKLFMELLNKVRLNAHL